MATPLARGEIRTTVLPPIPFVVGDTEDYEPGKVHPPPGPPAWWLRLLKPRVIVQHPFGTLDKAPAGDPGDWKPGAALVGFIAAAVVYFLVRGVVRTFWG